MKAPGCERIPLDDLTDYAAGELSGAAAAAIEEHLFSCAACGTRAAEFETLVCTIGPALRSGETGGFMTDALLNRLARDGMRIRAFSLSPGAIVPCAVWDDDELMALRLRGDFRDASEFTVSMHIAGNEVSRASGQMAAEGEIIYASPAAWVRQLPVVEVEITLTAHEGDQERRIGSYTLVHGGMLHR